ncbi:hypothetical protein ACVPPR_02445 [Dellaglioa sp. L3N]
MGRKGWIILLTFITVSVIGGNLYKVHEKKVEEKNELVQIKVEHKFVVELKKRVPEIKSIKFNKIFYNSWISAYTMDITLNSDYGSSQFNYNVKTNRIYELEDNNSDKGVTKGKVEVTYTNGKKTSI